MKRSTSNNWVILESWASSAPQRRGLAMFLVIVALAVVTVSTSAYLASRLNAPDASENVGRAVKARAAAETGVDIATAILESDSVDWRTAHVNGVLLDNYDFGAGTVTVTVEDLNGNPPTADTREIILTAAGSAGGLEQIAEIEVTAPPSTPDIQLDLGEFSVFGDDYVILTDSLFTVWDQSPSAALRKPLHIGTNGVGVAAIQLTWGTRMSQAYYHPLQGASEALLSDFSGMLNPPARKDLSEANPIPLPPGPTPNTTDYTLHPIYHPTISNGEWPITESTGVGGNLSVNDFADVVMATPGTSLLVNGDLDLLNGGDILISAPVNIVVNGDLMIGDFSSIELLPGGSLNLFVNGIFTIDGGVLGLVDTLVFDAMRDTTTGIGYYQDPARCKVYQLPTSPSRSWVITHKSYACATFYVPNVSMLVRRGSAVFGNIVANDILFKERSALFYDSALDSGWGYTNPDSFVYNADGTYDANVTTAVTDLDDTTINDIETYVNDVSSQLESKRDWRRVKKRMRRFGLRLKSYGEAGSSIEDDD